MWALRFVSVIVSVSLSSSVGVAHFPCAGNLVLLHQYQDQMQVLSSAYNAAHEAHSQHCQQTVQNETSGCPSACLAGQADLVSRLPELAKSWAVNCLVQCQATSVPITPPISLEPTPEPRSLNPWAVTVTVLVINLVAMMAMLGMALVRYRNALRFIHPLSRTNIGILATFVRGLPTGPHRLDLSLTIDGDREVYVTHLFELEDFS